MTPELRFTRVPSLDIEILHTSGVTHVYPPHLHEEYSIGVMLAGREVMTFGEREWIAEAGDVILVNADELHADRSIDAEYIVMKVKPAALPGVVFRTPVVRDRDVFAELSQLLRMLISDPSAGECPFEEFIARLLTHHANVPPAPPMKIAAIRDHLKAHFADDVPLDELTELAGMSRFHLLRLFREYAGVPPHEYQMQLRVAHARRLIRSGEPIVEAALETGFCDQSHLSRGFKRITGMTPGEYIAKSKIVQDRQPSRH